MRLLKKKRKGQDKTISQSGTLGLGQTKLTPALFAPFEGESQDCLTPRALRRRRAESSFPRSCFLQRLSTGVAVLVRPLLPAF